MVEIPRKELYIKWIVSTADPTFIDSKFKTNGEKEHTSLEGLAMSAKAGIDILMVFAGGTMKVKMKDYEVTYDGGG